MYAERFKSEPTPWTASANCQAKRRKAARDIVGRRRLTGLVISFVAALLGVTFFGPSGKLRRRALRVAFAASPRIDLDPLDWARSIFGFVIHGLGDVANFVYSIVGRALRGVYHVLNAIVDGVERGFEAVTHALGIVEQWISEAAGFVLHWANEAIGAFWRLASDWILRLLNDLRGWATEAFRYLWQLAQDGLHALEAIINGIYHEIILPILHWIAVAGEFVYHLIDAFWHTIYDNVIKPELDLLHHAWDLVGQLWHWFINDLPKVWHVLLKAWDWLVWLAVHSIEDLLGLWTGDLSHVNRQYVAQFARMDEEVLGVVDSAIRQVLG
jgi:hypothetical protein